MFHVKQKKDFLRTFALKAKIPIAEDQLNQLMEYAESIAQWNQRVHLISKNDVDFVVERHILPSLFFVKIIEEQTKDAKVRILDLGTGAGLPGVVLSIVKPGWDVVLLDSNRKKTLFLRRIKTDLKLNCEVVCERYEKYAPRESGEFDWLVARAVAPLGELVRLVSGHLKKGAKLLTIKGLDFAEELKGDEQKNFNLKFWPLKEMVNDNNDYLENKCMVSVEKIYG